MNKLFTRLPLEQHSLVELGWMFERTQALVLKATKRESLRPQLTKSGCLSDRLVVHLGTLSAAIEKAHAASLDDLRTKALALAYWRQGVDLETERWSNEETLTQQIIAGLTSSLQWRLTNGTEQNTTGPSPRTPKAPKGEDGPCSCTHHSFDQ